MAPADPAGRALGWLRDVLPRGGLLSEETWERRHRAIVVLLWLHAVVIAAVIARSGFEILHGLAEGSVVVLATLVAAQPRLSRRLRSVAASFGLLSASAILVHLSGGLIEMHFHFFVMIIVISLYQEWWPFLLAVGYVVAHHGIVGTIDPRSVFNHRAALEDPLLWAGIHGAFILAASAAAVVAWRLNEDLALRQLTIERRARAAAEAGVRAREDFLSVATHELRTPVTSIKGYSQLALRALDADPVRLRQTLETLDGQTDRLARLITQLLDVSRIEAGRLSLEPERLDLGLLVLTLVDGAMARPTAHVWEVDVPTGLYATVDGGRIEQVVSNLFDNAVRYSPDGGTISVRLRREGGTAQLEVADTGVGIAPEHLERVFDRFHQAHTERSYGGMGLGLYISREIVERHGGTITVASQPGGGASFRVTLPLHARELVAAAAGARPPERPRPRPAAASGAGARSGAVWIVEDDSDIRQILTAFLSDAGYDVAAFANGRLALDRLVAELPAVILLDKLMPEMDGTAFARALRARPAPHPKLIGMCAARDAQEWSASIGSVAVIRKPFDLDEVLREVAAQVPAPAVGHGAEVGPLPSS